MSQERQRTDSVMRRTKHGFVPRGHPYLGLGYGLGYVCQAVLNYLSQVKACQAVLNCIWHGTHILVVVDTQANDRFGEELEADILAEGEKLGPVEKITVFSKNAKGPVVIKVGSALPQGC